MLSGKICHKKVSPEERCPLIRRSPEERYYCNHAYKTNKTYKHLYQACINMYKHVYQACINSLSSIHDYDLDADIIGTLNTRIFVSGK